MQQPPHVWGIALAKRLIPLVGLDDDWRMLICTSVCPDGLLLDISGGAIYAMFTDRRCSAAGTRSPGTARPGDSRMRQGTGYAYGDGEDCISYKCEGCGRRVRVTPAQAQHFRGAFTACSRVCVLKARDLRTRQWRLDMGVPGPSEGVAQER